jgi:hypothetical protein
VNGAPYDIRRWVGHLDHLHEIMGNKCVEPRNNGLIDLKPLDIVPHVLSVHGAIDMVEHSELAECGVKESSLGGEGGVAIIQGDRYVGANVGVLDRGQSDGGGSISKMILGGNRIRQVG